MNKLGIFINFWEKNWDCDHAKYIKKASDLGFDVLEFQAQALLEMSKERMTELKKMADDNNIELTYSLGLDPRFDVSSADENIRQGGIEYLKKTRHAWWLSSWQIIIDRYPVLGEEIVISTWPYDFKGIYAYRNFTIQDKAGNYLVRANSIWFFYDLEAERPARIRLEDVERYGTGEERLDMEYAPRRITVPEEYEEKEPILVMKHHLDTNHHVNNAQYVEIVREFLPEHFQIGEMRVEYKKAAVLGDVIYPKVKIKDHQAVVALENEQGKPYAVVQFMEDKV